MKRFVYSIISVVLLSCGTEPVIQLPEAGRGSTMTDLPDALMQMYYDTNEPDSLHLKENNIAKDPSVIYIDKRLRLKHIMPHLKKHRDVKMYVPVIDTTANTTVFFDLSEVTYAENDQFSKFYIKDLPEQHMALLTLTLNFKANNEITVDGNPIERTALLSFLKEYIDFVSEGKNTLLYLNVNEELTFGDYISAYDLIMHMNGPEIAIAKTQFIYNEALLPDCNCEL